MSAFCIRNIGILGFGKMGSDIFSYFSEYDYKISILCYSDEEIEKAKKTYSRKLERKLKSGIIDESKFLKKASDIKFTTDKNDLFLCDLIIECVSEILSVKQELLSSIDNIVNKNCIIVSNSSSFIPSALLLSEKRKSNFVGLHFFYPLSVRNIVELITTKDNSISTISAIKDFLSATDRKYLQMEEGNAFVLNRLFMAFQAEAYNIIQEKNISFKIIDIIVKEKIFPSGVFEFFDSVGIDVMYASFKNYIEFENEKEIYLPLLDKFESLIKEGALGLKTRKGFYNYPTDKSSLAEAIIDDNLKIEIEKRLILKYVSSAEKIVNSNIFTADDLDYAVMEYMSIDKGPFATAVENKINLSY